MNVSDVDEQRRICEPNHSSCCRVHDARENRYGLLRMRIVYTAYVKIMLGSDDPSEAIRFEIFR